MTGRIEEDTELVNRLQTAGVQFSRVIEQESSPLVAFLITWLGPILIIVLLGQIFMRSMKKRMGGQDVYKRQEQRLTMQQALPLYTTNISVLEGRQALRGSLSIGKWADFVILDHDILQNPYELLNTNVCMTAMQGQITFQSQR